MPSVAACNLRHGVIWYTETQDQTQLQVAASRYELGITGKDFPSNKITIKNLNPNFLWFVYNSGTDNYVPPNSDTTEYDRLAALAAEHGWDPEDAYLHYWDDTVVTLQGTNVTIPGWGGGTATDRSQARVPVYYKDLTRRVVNFSNPRSLQLNKELMVELAFDTPFAGSSIYPDGLFLDNSAAKLFNYGILVSGGHVAEAPNHPLIGSATFQDWNWNQNFGPFLTALKDTLQTSASWSHDGKRKYLMINVANIWDDGYVNRDAADYVFMEFEYNPVRDFGQNMVAEAHRRDALAATAGISLFYAPTMTRTVSGRTGEYDYADIMLGNLAWYLTSRTPNTVLFEFGTASPTQAGWDSLTWRGCLDVATSSLGEATGDPFTLAQGTDPLGNPYTILARPYQGGLSVVRPRGDWNQGIEPETEVTVPLPSPLSPLQPDGDLGAMVGSISLRNGQGAVLLGGLVPVTLVSSSAVREPEGAVLTWETAGEAADHAGFHVYRDNAAGGRDRISTDLLTGTTRYRFVDTRPPATATRYWLADLSRSGTVTWLGPLSLGPTVAAPAGLRLAQNRPNPFRAGTAIHFSLPRAGAAHLRVHDLAGRVVAVLVDGDLPAGDHTASWNGRDARGAPVAPGVYFYVLQTPDGTLTRKLAVLP